MGGGRQTNFLGKIFFLQNFFFEKFSKKKISPSHKSIEECSNYASTYESEMKTTYDKIQADEEGRLRFIKEIAITIHEQLNLNNNWGFGVTKFLPQFFLKKFPEMFFRPPFSMPTTPKSTKNTTPTFKKCHPKMTSNGGTQLEA